MSLAGRTQTELIKVVLRVETKGIRYSAETTSLAILNAICFNGVVIRGVITAPAIETLPELESKLIDLVRGEVLASCCGEVVGG